MVIHSVAAVVLVIDVAPGMLGGSLVSGGLEDVAVGPVDEGLDVIHVLHLDVTAAKFGSDFGPDDRGAVELLGVFDEDVVDHGEVCLQGGGIEVNLPVGLVGLLVGLAIQDGLQFGFLLLGQFLDIVDLTAEVGGLEDEGIHGILFEPLHHGEGFEVLFQVPNLFCGLDFHDLTSCLGFLVSHSFDIIR